MQYLEFKMGKTSYGIELDNIIEIIENIEITQIPVADKFVKGITNIREKVMPVYNLANKLGIMDFQDYYDEKYGNQYLIVEHNGKNIALEISLAENIKSITEDEIRNLPEGFIPDEPLVKYMVKEEKDLISILDIKRFFNEELNSLIQIGS